MGNMNFTYNKGLPLSRDPWVQLREGRPKTSKPIDHTMQGENRSIISDFLCCVIFQINRDGIRNKDEPSKLLSAKIGPSGILPNRHLILQKTKIPYPLWNTNNPGMGEKTLIRGTKSVIICRKAGGEGSLTIQAPQISHRRNDRGMPSSAKRHNSFKFWKGLLSEKRCSHLWKLVLSILIMTMLISLQFTNRHVTNQYVINILWDKCCTHDLLITLCLVFLLSINNDSYM